MKSYDIIGDIIVIKIHPELWNNRHFIAEKLRKRHPKVRTIAVVSFYGSTHELYRTRDLEVIWGDENMETIHKESGCLFKMNLKQVFFSPRLSYERMRIAMKVLPEEKIINMFSGVGCFSIIIAKMQPSAKIYSIDMNPYAYRYMKENIALNKVENVIPILGDAREETKELEGIADRVIMPLPEKALSFLPLAAKALKKEGGIIHYYDVASGRRKKDLLNASFESAKNTFSFSLGDLFAVEVEEEKVVRSVASCKYHIVLDLVLKRRF